MSQTYTVQLAADISDLQAELARIPGFTEKSASAAALKGALQLQKMGGAAKDVKRETGEVGDGLLELADLAGLPADQFEKLLRGAGALSAPIGVAAVAVGGLGLAVVGASAAMVTTVRAAEELNKELEPLYAAGALDPIPAESLERIEAANDAMDGLGALAKQAVVILGAEFAPALEATGRLLLKFGLMALDSFNAIAAGGNVLRDLAIFLTQKMVQALAAPVSGLVKLASLTASLASALGADPIADKLNGVVKAWDGFTRDIAETTVDFYVKEFGKLEDFGSDYNARVDKLMAGIRDTKTKTEGGPAGAGTKAGGGDWLAIDPKTAAQLDLLSESLGEFTDESVAALNDLALTLDQTLPALAAALEKQALANQRVEQIGKVGEAIANPLGAGLGLLSAAGPTGMVASAGIGLASQVGQMGAEGADQLLTGIRESFMSLATDLPKIIGTVIPDFVLGIARELPIALADSLDELIAAVVIELPASLIAAAPALFASLLTELPVSIARSLAELINPFDRASRERRGRIADRVREAFGIDDGFIAKNGQVTPINSKDNVLAFQDGGPADPFSRSSASFVPVYQHFGRFSADEALRRSPLRRAIQAGPRNGSLGY